MNITDLLQLRLQNQHLLNTTFKTPEELVSWFGAVQSQDYAGAKWALGQRLPGTTDQIIEKAFNRGEILRTHVMRPTWHFVAPEDIRWMLKLTGPRVTRVMSSYNKVLELNDAVFHQAQKIIVSFLNKTKHATRLELKQELEQNGITTNVQRLAHIVMQAELDGIICSGPREGKSFTYMLLEDRVPKAKILTHEEALAELTKRFFQSHGPALLQDFVWWSGLLTADAKKGIELHGSKLNKEIIGGKEFYFFSSIHNTRYIIHNTFLLPNYDEYGVAYKDRTAFFNPEFVKLLGTRGNAAFQHMILYDGKLVGMWKRTLKKESVLIEYQFFEKPIQNQQKSFEVATDQYGSFLGLNASVVQIA